MRSVIQAISANLLCSCSCADVRTGTATYETGQTRQFYHGRTETVRSFSTESVEWTKAMKDPSASKEKRIELLRRATEYHSRTLMNDAVNGPDPPSRCNLLSQSNCLSSWTAQATESIATCWACVS